MADLKALSEELVNLTIKEATELFNILKNEHGIEPAAVAPVMVAHEATDGNTTAAKEKSEFDVILKSAGSAKLPVVKLIKEIVGVGLKEAKELVDNAPKIIKGKLPKIDAEAMKKQLEETGAEVELK